MMEDSRPPVETAVRDDGVTRQDPPLDAFDLLLIARVRAERHLRTEHKRSGWRSLGEWFLKRLQRG